MSTKKILKEAIDKAVAEAKEEYLARKVKGICNQCGTRNVLRGAWGLCNTHYRYAKAKVVKDALIKAMGGKCQNCGGTFGRRVYEFHHSGPKTADPTRCISKGRHDAIAAELSECELLCANCHRQEHEV